LRRAILTLTGAAVVAVALPVAADATHKPGHAPNSGGRSLTITVQPTSVAFGSATTISGRLKDPNRGGRTVTLRADGYPFNVGDKAVATTRTTSSGAYSFTRRPARNTNYQTTVDTLRTSRVRVNVRFRVSFAASDYTPRKGRVIRLRGRACPGSDGAVVRIQRRSATGTFPTVRKTRLRAAKRCSVYSLRVRVRRGGVYRATTDDRARARGYSALRVITTH
jgi:hypothetical protein